MTFRILHQNELLFPKVLGIPIQMLYHILQRAWLNPFPVIFCTSNFRVNMLFFQYLDSKNTDLRPFVRLNFSALFFYPPQQNVKRRFSGRLPSGRYPGPKPGISQTEDKLPFRKTLSSKWEIFYANFGSDRQKMTKLSKSGRKIEKTEEDGLLFLPFFPGFESIFASFFMFMHA